VKCPLCPDSTLVIADRQGIEIDYCPTCRGVWLDRGELDKLIERAAAATAGPAAPATTPPAPATAGPPPAAPTPAGPAPRPLPWYDDDWDDDRSYSSKGKPYKPKKRKAKSLFEEIFDF
jgi:Zn-finger nucleic acid-binding protein